MATATAGATATGEKRIRFGILGAAGIAKKNWGGIALSGNAVVTVVGSRTLHKAQAFIDECQAKCPQPDGIVPRAVETYEAVLMSDDVDAVYIPLPTAVRTEWVIKAAAAGKHVLSEKPACPTVADLQRAIDACRKHNVHYMDGVMFVHSTRLQALRKVMDDSERFGTLRHIANDFSFCGDSAFLKDDIRCDSDMEPLGALGDLGWYNIRMVLWSMQYRLPSRVTGRIIQTKQNSTSAAPVNSQFSGELLYDNGDGNDGDGDDSIVSAQIYCSFRNRLQQWCHLSGSKGSIHMDDFVLPKFGCDVSFLHERNEIQSDASVYSVCQRGECVKTAQQEYGSGHVTAQETRMIQCFATTILSGDWSSYEWADITMKTQQVVNACLESARQGGKEVKLQE